MLRVYFDAVISLFWYDYYFLDNFNRYLNTGKYKKKDKGDVWCSTPIEENVKLIFITYKKLSFER